MNQSLRELVLDGGGWILERLTELNAVERNTSARRLLSESMQTWSGEAETYWWKWMGEVAVSLGLRAKAVDCTVEEVLELADDEGQLLVLVGDSQKGHRLIACGDSRLYLADGTQRLEMPRPSKRRVRELLGTGNHRGYFRCVFVRSATAGSSADAQHEKPSPLNRLLRILQPEWSDIWLVVLFALVAGVLMLATPIAVETLVNTVAFGRFLQPVIVLALVLLVFLGFLAAMRGLQTYVVEIIQRRLFARVVADLAYRLPRVETKSSEGKYLPELMNRFFDIVTVQKIAAQLLLDGVGLVMATLIGMAVLGFYHPWLLGFDIVLLASIAFIIFVLGRGAVPSAVRESARKYEAAAWLEDVARCPATFRGDGGAYYAMDRADRLIHDYLTERRAHFRVLMRQIIFALALQALASTALLGLGGWLVISGQLTLGQLVAAELIVTAIVGAFAKLGKHMEGFYDLLASVDKLGKLFDLSMERQDGLLHPSSRSQVGVEFDNLGCKRSNGTALWSGLNSRLLPGSSLAIVGGSGTGKSALLDMIYGLRQPSSGSLVLDGMDPQDLRPDVFRSRAAMVRGIEVFHGTIEDNLHLQRAHVSDVDAREALSGVGLLETAVELPAGLDTILNSGGAPFTENQCRLLTIARAIAGKPGLLLIDGVLDALPDEELEVVLNCLLSEDRPWTLIIATGRDDIARRCAECLQLGRTAEVAA